MTDSDSLRGDPDRAPRLPPVAELETLRSELARVRALLRPRMEETDEAFVAETIRGMLTEIENSRREAAAHREARAVEAVGAEGELQALRSELALVRAEAGSLRQQRDAFRQERAQARELAHSPGRQLDEIAALVGVDEAGDGERDTSWKAAGPVDLVRGFVAGRREFLERAVCHPGPPLSEHEDYDPEADIGELEASVLERMDLELKAERELRDIRKLCEEALGRTPDPARSTMQVVRDLCAHHSAARTYRANMEDPPVDLEAHETTRRMIDEFATYPGRDEEGRLLPIVRPEHFRLTR